MILLPDLSVSGPKGTTSALNDFHLKARAILWLRLYNTCHTRGYEVDNLPCPRGTSPAVSGFEFRGLSCGVWVLGIRFRVPGFEF